MSDALGDLQIVVIITENHAMQTILEPVKNHAIAKSAMYVKGFITEATPKCHDGLRSFFSVPIYISKDFMIS